MKYRDTLEVSIGNSCLCLKIPMSIPLSYVGVNEGSGKLFVTHGSIDPRRVSEEALATYLECSKEIGGKYLGLNVKGCHVTSPPSPSRVTGIRVLAEPWILLKEGNRFYRNRYQTTIGQWEKNQESFRDNIESWFNTPGFAEKLRIAGSNFSGPNYRYYYGTFTVDYEGGVKKLIDTIAKSDPNAVILKMFVDDVYNRIWGSYLNLLEYDRQ